MKHRSGLITDLLATDHRREKIGRLGNPLSEIESCSDFSAWATDVDRVTPRPISPQDGRPPFPIETMTGILVPKRLHKPSGKQMESSCSGGWAIKDQQGKSLAEAEHFA